MRSPTAGPVLVLTGAGLLLALMGAAGIFAGLALGDAIHALLPDEVTADADAVGGAALALGTALSLVAVAHLATALSVSRGRWLVAGVVLSAVMCALVLGWAVTAVVSAAAGSAPASGMLPAGIGLAVVAGAYAWAALVLLDVRRRAGPAI